MASDEPLIRTDTDRSVKASRLNNLPVRPPLGLREAEVGKQGQQHEIGPQLQQAVEAADPQVVADEADDAASPEGPYP